MSSPAGLAFRLSRLRGFSANGDVTAELQLDVYSLDTISLASAAIARRSPEFVSHAIAASSRFGRAAVGVVSVLGLVAVAVISVLDPHALPPQIQALTSSFVSSPPIRPIWLLAFFAASLISGYWASVA